MVSPDIECPDSKGIKTKSARVSRNAALILNALIQKGLRRNGGTLQRLQS